MYVCMYVKREVGVRLKERGVMKYILRSSLRPLSQSETKISSSYMWLYTISTGYCVSKSRAVSRSSYY